MEFSFHDAVVHARFPCTQIAVEFEFANLLDALAVSLQSVQLVFLGFVRRVCEDGQLVRSQHLIDFVDARLEDCFQCIVVVTVVRVVVMAVVAMIIVAVAIMVGMVIMTVVTMIVVAVTPVTVFVVVSGKLRYQCFALCEQAALLVGDFSFHFRNLALNLFQRLCDAVGSHNTQGIHGGNQVVVGQAKFTIVSGVTSRPVKLL